MAVSYKVTCDDGTAYLCHTMTDAEQRVKEMYRKKKVRCYIDTDFVNLS